MKVLVGAFNQEKALVGAFSVIVKTDCEIDGSFYNTTQDTAPGRVEHSPGQWSVVPGASGAQPGAGGAWPRAVVSGPPLGGAGPWR